MKDELMCRIDPDLHEMAVEKNGCHTMSLGKGSAKRIMKGYVLVDETGIKSNADFDYWINLLLDYNPKAKAGKKK